LRGGIFIFQNTTSQPFTPKGWIILQIFFHDIHAGTSTSDALEKAAKEYVNAKSNVTG
jgi:hypothetical protein